MGYWGAHTEHAPGAFRANGVVSQNKNFARIFECPSGTAMNPLHRCAMWKSVESGSGGVQGAGRAPRGESRLLPRQPGGGDESGKGGGGREGGGRGGENTPWQRFEEQLQQSTQAAQRRGLGIFKSVAIDCASYILCLLLFFRKEDVGK